MYEANNWVAIELVARESRVEDQLKPLATIT